MDILESSEWKARLSAHEATLRPLAERRLQRRHRGESHPVEDFLFTYYSLTPTKLCQWQPGTGVALRIGGEPLPTWFQSSRYRTEGDLVFAALPQPETPAAERVRRVRQLLEATASRPPQLRCYGLHEWAMVYRVAQGEVRHEDYPLRLPSEDLAAFVESRSLVCTHYDAFRFFTAEAAPLNSHQPTLESRVLLEQPGCIHANMDLYKWAYKLGPLVPGELLAKTFLFAAEAREIDMRASPYDLESLGFDPIRIETESGRAEYREAQERLAEKAVPLRATLLSCCRRALAGQASLTTE